jgi:hypothetical protein
VLSQCNEIHTIAVIVQRLHFNKFLGGFSGMCFMRWTSGAFISKEQNYTCGLSVFNRYWSSASTDRVCIAGYCWTRCQHTKCVFPSSANHVGATASLQPHTYFIAWSRRTTRRLQPPAKGIQVERMCICFLLRCASRGRLYVLYWGVYSSLITKMRLQLWPLCMG